MRWRWLLLVVAGLMVSAGPPQKEVSYEKPKEPTGDYLKVEIRGTLEVEERGARFLATIRPAPPARKGRPAKAQPYGGVLWHLSLKDEKELQDVVRKLRGMKVIVRGIATEPAMGLNWNGGPLFSDVEVTSLRAAAEKK